MATTAETLKLVREAAKESFDGAGKLEPLKGRFSGMWSRRNTGEHRLVYGMTDERIRILACRYHYA